MNPALFTVIVHTIYCFTQYLQSKNQSNKSKYYITNQTVNPELLSTFPEALEFMSHTFYITDSCPLTSSMFPLLLPVIVNYSFVM